MSTKQLIMGSAGVYAAYLTLSLVNERLFTHQYINIHDKLGDEFRKDKFKYPDLCVCISSLFCALFAHFRSKMQKHGKNMIPFKQYIILGVLYTINILSASYALLYISYPIRVVSDKCGYLTAVIVGVYFSRIVKSDSRLQPKKVVIAIIITMGAVLFAVTRQQQASKAWGLVYNPDTVWIGYLLMFISISGQALFTDSQAYCKLTYRPTINHLMYTVNFMTTIICFVGMILKNDIINAIIFCHSHPYVVLDLILIGLLQVLGQISIYFIVLNFKQHIFPLVSTTRKVFTVLLSIFIFNHKMNFYQWIALILVFGGMGYELVDQLYLDMYGKHKKIKDNKKNQGKQQQQIQIKEQQQNNKSKQILLKNNHKKNGKKQPWYNRLKMEPEDYQFQTQDPQNSQLNKNTPSKNKKKGKNNNKIRQNLVFQQKKLKSV